MSKNILVFPGQGSQVYKMGESLAKNNSTCMHYWDAAEEYSMLPLKKIYWEENNPEAMIQTKALQPALTAVALSLYHMYSQNNDFSAVLGHSLGEYPALVACGTLSAEDALILTAERGNLMQNVDKEHSGGMCAILKLSLPTIELLLEDLRKDYEATLFIANYNSPSQYVISGDTKYFTLLKERVAEHKGKAIPLQVSGAFHSPKMEKAEKALQKKMENSTWENPTRVFYSTVTASALQSSDTIYSAMKKQMTHSVRFIETVEKIYHDGYQIFSECGAKSVLLPLIKAICPSEKEGRLYSSYDDVTQ
ncbi:MAG: ACP S-malonyltransferase [Desulfovibrionaceae bacterium]